VWRNGRRTGLKIAETALSGHYLRQLVTHTKVLYLFAKISFYRLFQRHHLGRDFNPKSSTKSSTDSFRNPLNIKNTLAD
jgi:hypothetical protein